LLQRYPGRWTSLHLKDRLPGTPDSPDGRADDETNVVLGTGDVDIAAVVAEARRQGIHWFFIEDESAQVLTQVPESLAYLESLGMTPNESSGRPSDLALAFMPEVRARTVVAPTEFDPWRGRLLQGEVHDENAALLGSVAAPARSQLQC